MQRKATNFFLNESNFLTATPIFQKIRDFIHTEESRTPKETQSESTRLSDFLIIA